MSEEKGFEFYKETGTQEFKSILGALKSGEVEDDNFYSIEKEGDYPNHISCLEDETIKMTFEDFHKNIGFTSVCKNTGSRIRQMDHLLAGYLEENPDYTIKFKIGNDGLYISDDFNDYMMFYVEGKKGNKNLKLTKSSNSSEKKEPKKKFSAIKLDNEVLWEHIIECTKNSLKKEKYQFLEDGEKCYISKEYSGGSETISVDGYAKALKQMKKLKLDIKLPSLSDLLVLYSLSNSEYGATLAFNKFDISKGWNGISCIDNKKMLYTIPISATLPELQEFASKRGKCFNCWQGNAKKYSSILKKSNQTLENTSILLRKKKLNKPQQLNYIIYGIISVILIIVIALVIYNC